MLRGDLYQILEIVSILEGLYMSNLRLLQIAHVT
jgi:hypothetical protein